MCKYPHHKFTVWKWIKFDGFSKTVMCIPLSSSHSFAVTCRICAMHIHRRLLQFSLICVRHCHPIVWREGYVHPLSQSLRWSRNQISFISEAVLSALSHLGAKQCVSWIFISVFMSVVIANSIWKIAKIWKVL